MRFREKPIAVVENISAMFYQVLVHQEDTDSLQFLWWDGRDLRNELSITYKMQVHLFGAASSPFWASFALKQVTEDNKQM